MKNNKGYTLIEIIVALVLIVLIGTISIVSINKTKKHDEEAEFLEKIKLDAAVYYENNKHLEKFEDLLKTGDFQIIRIGDLISEGILNENLYNPYKNGATGDFKDDCVKIILDDNLNIDIQYEELIDAEKCSPPEKKSLHIHLNDGIKNEVLLDYSLYTEYGTELRKKISNGDIIKEKFKDPGAVLKDEYTNKIYGELVGTFTFKNGVATYTYSVNEDYKCSDGTKCYDRIVEKEATRTVTYDDKRERLKIKMNDEKPIEVSLENSYDMYINHGTEAISNGDYIGDYIKEKDIDIGAQLVDRNDNVYGELTGVYTFDKTTKKGKYTYSVNEDFLYYDLVDKKTDYRIVEYEDESGPIIINTSKNIYYKHEDEIEISYDGEVCDQIDDYIIFDNLDGITTFSLDEYYDCWVESSYMNKDIELKDKTGNSTNYTLNISMYSNEPPIIEYNTLYNSFYEDQIRFYKGEIWPIYKYINVYDEDSDYEYTYWLTASDGVEYYPWNEDYLLPDVYTLYIEAYDEKNNFVSEEYTIFICEIGTCDPWCDECYEPWDDEDYDIDEDEDFEYGNDEDGYCDDACILEEMMANTCAWHGADSATQQKLHNKNESLSNSLSYDVEYSNGWWYLPNGEILYEGDC